MTIKKPTTSKRGAPFRTPAKSKVAPVENQTVVALQGELKQLVADIEAISAGAAGSTFGRGDKARLKSRVTALKPILARFNREHAKRA